MAREPPTSSSGTRSGPLQVLSPDNDREWAVEMAKVEGIYIDKTWAHPAGAG